MVCKEVFFVLFVYDLSIFLFFYLIEYFFVIVGCLLSYLSFEVENLLLFYNLKWNGFFVYVFLLFRMEYISGILLLYYL